MLLSPSANRIKSWTCEHCINWKEKNPEFCIKCFWSHPEDYEHIAGKRVKIINLYFSGDEIKDYDKLIALTGINNAQNLIKNLIHKFLSQSEHE